MNELIDQFLVEARELIQSASEDLLALERAPDDAEAVNRVFRAFHTLKGSVALFDFPPMLDALHAAEDGLVAVRAGTLPVDAALIDLSLDTLDATGRWTDAVEATGRLPEDASAVGAGLADRFRALLAPGAEDPAPPGAGARPDWVDGLLAAADAATPGTQLLAVRYVPRADCFFSGEDPLGLVRRVPSLLAVQVEPAAPWPPVEELDVFACNLAVALLTAAPRADVEAVFRLVADQTTVLPVAAEGGGPPAREPATRAGSALDAVTAAVLAEQLLVLATAVEPAAEAGHREAAAAAAVNALIAGGLELEAARCARAASESADALSRVLTAIVEAGAPSGASAASDGGPEAAGAGEAARTLRVDAARVDALVTLVGELVVARNALGHLVAEAEAEGGRAALARSIRASDAVIGRLATELHRGIVSLRLLPLAQVFRRFARPVREAARGLGKEIAFAVEGEDTEADRLIVENLFEPLLHVIRNALDHGLESAEVRRGAGKPAGGRIVLRAERAGDSVAVSVSDDGRGIDAALVRRRAAERGLLSEEAAAALDDAAATDLIFAPGFSTAETVSAVSGRGVGMDAVRAAAERLGGSISVESRVGLGTTVRLLLPHAIALTRMVVVGAGQERYGIPMDAVVEVVRLPRERVHAVGGGSATVLRGRTLPVVRLAGLLGSHAAAPDADPEALLLVVRRDGEAVGFEVDRIEDRFDALVRTASGLVATLPGVVGTTLLGDGQVLLILDPATLLAATGGGSRSDRETAR